MPSQKNSPPTAIKKAIVITKLVAIYGATVTAPDLRGGAALVLAGLGVGDGSCVRVLDAGHIRRGYADLARDLRRLGADCRAGRTGTEAGRQTKKL